MNNPLTAAPTAPISPEEQALLNQLADIALPDPIAWWHFSSVFWLASISSIIALGVLAYTFWQHRAANRYRTEALSLLNEIRRKATHSPIDYPINKVMQSVNTLLKRCCYTAAPSSRAVLAKHYGQHWYLYLIGSVKPCPHVATRDTKQLAQRWQQASYASSTLSAEDLHLYFTFCAHWITHHQLTVAFPSARRPWWQRLSMTPRGHAND